MATRAIEKDVYVEGKKLDNWKAICSAETGRVFTIVSSSYAVVQHDDVISIVKEVARKVFREPEIKYYEYKNGARLWMQILDRSAMFEVVPGDTIIPAIYVRNSYDRRSGVNFRGGFFRVVCANLAVLNKEFELIASRKHIGNEVIEDIREIFESLIESIINTYDLLRASAENKISVKEAIEMLEVLKIPAKCREYIISKISQMKEVSRWELYNYGTEFITHKSEANMDRKVKLLQTLSGVLVVRR